MRYPNLRYGNPAELAHFAMGYGNTANLAEVLRRDERTVRDWLSGRTKVPWWVPELLRLRHMEAADRHRQMGFTAMAPRLGIVRAGVIDLAEHKAKKADAHQSGPALSADHVLVGGEVIHQLDSESTLTVQPSLLTSSGA